MEKIRRSSSLWISRGKNKFILPYGLDSCEIFKFWEYSKVKDDSENGFQIINMNDAWSILTEKFLYNSTKKMVKIFESLDQKYDIEGVSAKKFIMDRLLGYKGVDFKNCS